MAINTCHSCNKSQQFLERMMYCAFCGTHYTETEMYNAAQRLKQDVVVDKWRYGYFFGGIFFLFIILPLLMKSLIPVAMHEIIGLLAFLMCFAVALKVPLARGHAQKLYPEKGA